MAPLVGSQALERPGEGWIRYLRRIIGMKQAQLASRLGISRQSLHRIETAEVEGRVTLRSLRRVAEQLGCRVEYVLIPECGSTDELVRRQAARLAERRVKDIATSMELEGQGLGPEELSRMRDELQAELMQDTPSRLWEEA